jgi:hypothetical protein
MEEGISGLNSKIGEFAERSGKDFNEELPQLSVDEWYQIRATAVQLAMGRLSDPRPLRSVLKKGAADVQVIESDMEAAFDLWRYSTGKRLNENEKKSRQELPLLARGELGLIAVGIKSAGSTLERYDLSHDGAIEVEFEERKQRSLPSANSEQ